MTEREQDSVALVKHVQRESSWNPLTRNMYSEKFSFLPEEAMYFVWWTPRKKKAKSLESGPNLQSFQREETRAI